MNNKERLRLSLQFFADGAEAGNGTGDGGTGELEMTPRMAELQKKYGIDFAQASGSLESADSQLATDGKASAGGSDTESAEAPSKTAEEEFEELISGRFKDLYEKKSAERTEKAVKSRLKNHAESKEKNSKYEKALSRLAYHYGKDKADYEGIIEAIDADDTWLEDEAYEKNMSIAALREQERTQTELAELRASLSEKEAREKKERTFKQWNEESKATSELYPTFDPQKEFKNPKFLKALAYYGNVTEAYEATHVKELLSATAKAVEERTAENLAKMYARGKSHPTESASNVRATARTSFDPSKLTHKELADLRERIARGEQPFGS